MHKSLFARYFSVCVTLVIVCIIVLGAVFLIFASRYFKNDKYNLLRGNMERTAEIMQDYYKNDIFFDSDMISNYMTALAETIDATIFITDTNGKTIFCTESTPCRQTENNVPSKLLKSILENGEYSEMGKLGGVYQERYYTFALPVKFDGKVTGYLFASSHAISQQQHFLSEMFKMFVISAIAVTAITFVAVYFITAKMVKPLREMSAAAQKFGRGEFDIRVPVTSYDEMGQLTMALNNMAQSLSILEVTRRSFVANISHELKTPMTSISGFIDGILDGTIPPEKQNYYLQIVSDETKRLSRLVKTMLNLSRIEAGEMKIKKSNINIVDIICQTVFSFEQQIEKKNLMVRGLDHESVMVEADSDLMHQVVYNLTENAVKFVNEGGYLEFNFSKNNNIVYIGVKNSGKGISKEEMPKIFDRFYKSDRSRGLDKNGVGLGLYIVRSIVNLHGGDIIVRSVQGEYSEFVFSVPMGKQTAKFKKNS